MACGGKCGFLAGIQHYLGWCQAKQEASHLLGSSNPPSKMEDVAMVFPHEIKWKKIPRINTDSGVDNDL